MRDVIGSFRYGTTLLIGGMLVAVMPSATEASLAKRLGTSYSTSLSSNTSTRTQSLTGDPDNVIRGSASTTYEPGKVRLDAIYPLENFMIQRAYVEVSFDNGTTTDLIEFPRFLAERNRTDIENPFVETGYLQVFFAANDVDNPPPPDPGFEVDRGGAFDGDKTHLMVFNYIAPDPTTVANYTYYADNGSRGTSPDFLTFTDIPEGGGEPQVFTATATEIAGAEVSGPLVPEPATAAIALAGCGLAVLRRGRRR